MLETFLTETFIYFLIISLFLLGVYGIVNKKNLLKKLLALNVMQVAVITFFLVLGQKKGATVPIIQPGLLEVDYYTNPLPQTLMLTAVVVSLAIAGVGLVFLKKIASDYGSIEEDHIIATMNAESIKKAENDKKVENEKKVSDAVDTEKLTERGGNQYE